MADQADIDRDELQEVVDVIGFDEAYEILDMRDLALNAHDPMGKHFAYGAMRVMYGQYTDLVPKHWLYYHGGGKQ